MNKKIFKRLLIATSMIAPIAIVTPMILTSCNDNKNDTNDNNSISIGDLNSLLKKKDQTYWLDVVDFHGGSFNGFNQIKDFYNGLVKNKMNLINSLINDQKFKFQPTETNIADSNGKPTNYFANELVLTKDTYSANSDVENLKSTFQNLLLSNIFDVKDDGTSTPSKGVTIKGEDLNFSELLSKAKINSKITFIDEAIDATNDKTTNAIRKKNRYQIVYNIQPKDGYGWKGVPEADRQLPLVITLNDYVTDISIIDQLDQIKVTQNGSNNEIVLNINATVDDTKDNIVTNLKNQIGVDLSNDITNGNATSNSITKINEFFQLLSDEAYKITITGENKTDTAKTVDVKDNFLTKNKILENDISKKRMDFYVRSGKKDNSDTKLITIEAVIDIKKTVNNNYDFNWFGGQASDNSLNAPIIMKFNITATK